MNNMIAYCGLNCETCEARIATINNDDTLREKVATLWSKLNKVEITKEMINCEGCKSDGIKTIFCSTICEIRKCAINKKTSLCMECHNFSQCTKIKQITENNDFED